jgi:hypothetical protein
MIEFVHVDVDGMSLRIGLKVERDRSARLASAQWTATANLPAWTTPRASIDIRGVGPERAAAVRDALTKLNEAIARYENARRKPPRARMLR